MIFLCILLKKVVSILMLFALITSVFSQGIVVMRYIINKQFIAEKLCVNRSRPMLECNGKCVLAKKLQQQEKQQQDSGISFTEKFEVLSNQSFFSELPALPLIVLGNFSFPFFNQRPVDMPAVIFHPPDKSS